MTYKTDKFLSADSNVSGLKRKQMKKIIVFVITLCMIAGCSGLKPDEAVKNTPADNTDSNTHADSAADKPVAPGQEESALKPDVIVKNDTTDNTDLNGSNTQKALTKLILIAIPAAIIAGVVYYAYKVFCRGNIKGADKTDAVPLVTEGRNQELEVVKKPGEVESPVKEPGSPLVQQIIEEEEEEEGVFKGSILKEAGEETRNEEPEKTVEESEDEKSEEGRKEKTVEESEDEKSEEESEEEKSEEGEEDELFLKMG
jgi:hypothetical protein